METIQFILDYFFGNFWHYLMLLILLIAVGHKGNYIVHENHIHKEEE
jgi:hypothetical protein